MLTTYVLDEQGRVAAMSIGALIYWDLHPVIKDIAAKKA